MKGLIRHIFSWLLGTVLVLFILSSCTREENWPAQGGRYFEIEPPGTHSSRLQNINQALPFTRDKAGASMADEDIVFTLRYLLEGPVVQGVSVQASHIDVSANQVYISYNVAGDPVLGGYEVIDFEDPDHPTHFVMGTAGREFSSLSVQMDPVSRAPYLLLAGGRLKETGIIGAELLVMSLDAAGLPLLPPDIVALKGYVATDTDGWGVVTGTDGGFSQIIPGNPPMSASSIDLEDVRSVAYNASSGEYLALQGQPARLVTGLPDHPETIPLTGLSIPNSKAIVRLLGDLAFISLGERGLQVIHSESEEVLFSLPAPTVPPGADEADYVTHGVYVASNGWFYVANGAAGITVARVDSLGVFHLVGSIDLDAGVNFVTGTDQYLYAACGKKGVALIEMGGGGCWYPGCPYKTH